MTTEKLQKVIAHAGIASRRAAEELIAQGKVKVNGTVASIGQRVDASRDVIEVQGKPLPLESPHRYFLINKPQGVLSTTDDELGRETVLDLLPDIEERLYPVGRLDQDSEGLMLVTNDGQLTHLLTHPSHKVSKIYQVLPDRPLTEKAFQHLEKGVKLDHSITTPVRVENLGENWLEIEVTEGRNRLVRRMLERVGYDTVRLIRVTHGPFDLDMLDNHQYIELPPEKVRQLTQSLV